MKLLFLLLSLILYPFSFSAWAAPPSFDNADAASAENVTSLGFSFTTAGTNRFMLGCSWVAGPSTVTTFAYNSVSGTSVTQVNNTDQILGEMFKLAPTIGTNTAQFDFSELTNPVIGVMSFTDVDPSVPVGTFGSAGVVGADILATVDVTSTADELVADCFGVQDKSMLSAQGAGQTERFFLNYSSAHDFSGATEAGAGTVTMSRTWDGGYAYYTIIAIPLKPVAAVPTTVLRRPGIQY